MLRIRKATCIFLLSLLLVQPVFAETEAPTAPEPDIVTAVYPVQTLPGDISPLADRSDEELWLRSLTTAPLYVMNADGSWEPILAQALPEDVTAEYAGTYGIPADAQRGYAFCISLHSDARWEDDTAITADDCIFSIKKLFQDKNTTDDWAFLANAEAILSKKRQPGSEIISLRDAEFSGVSEAWAAGYTDFFVDMDGFWGLDCGWKSVSDRTRVRDFAMRTGLDEYFVSPAYLYNFYLMNGAQSRYYQTEFIGICKYPGKTLSTDDLGLVKVSDKKMVVITAAPSTASMLMQQLEPFFLFHESGNTKLSYGPYRIISATDAELILEPNPCWWGAPDHRGYDRILCQKIGT